MKGTVRNILVQVSTTPKCLLVLPLLKLLENAACNSGCVNFEVKPVLPNEIEWSRMRTAFRDVQYQS